MKRSSSFYAVLLIAGICALVASFFFRGEELKPVSGVLLGIGSGLIGLSIANLWMKRIEHNHPGYEKEVQIEYNDERNTIIRNRAKAKAGDITQWLIMAVAYITIIISAPLWVTFAAVAVFLFYNFFGLLMMKKYQNEM
jgi:hypothetical protein